MGREIAVEPRAEVPWGGEMRTPDEVAAMLRLKALGWGIKRIARELGCSHMTVRRYVAGGGYVPFRRPAGRPRALAGLDDWVAERFRRHAGNADVVRQELRAEKGIILSLRTIEREVAPLRRELAIEARATTRFETPPGHQLQIDFGERRIMVADVPTKVFLFVATLGYSRRMHVRAFRNERQESWLEGLESTFRHFGGTTAEILLDNDRGLVTRHDVQTREVTFNAKFLAFARHWGFRPRACAPCRARTKGKDERGVGYVKRNAVAGRSFPSFAALEAHLDEWVREIADTRVHGTTGEVPMDRFARDETAALRPIAGIPSFQAMRELMRRVQADCAIEVDGNAYSVPWRLIGEQVRVAVTGEELRVSHAGREVAVHARQAGRRQRIVDAAHFDGVAGFGPRRPDAPLRTVPGAEDMPSQIAPSELLRPLADYEALIGGGF